MSADSLQVHDDRDHTVRQDLFTTVSRYKISEPNTLHAPPYSVQHSGVALPHGEDLKAGVETHQGFGPLNALEANLREKGFSIPDLNYKDKDISLADRIAVIRAHVAGQQPVFRDDDPIRDLPLVIDPFSTSATAAVVIRVNDAGSLDGSAGANYIEPEAAQFRHQDGTKIGRASYRLDG